MRALVPAAALSLATVSFATVDRSGAACAVLSGALASGVGYAVWYTALPDLRAISAATVQLSVPVIAAIGGIVFLDEAVTLRLFVASVAILGGIALVIVERRGAR
jgi:drug/metabolite transporter (DMT)-like permease